MVKAATTRRHLLAGIGASALIAQAAQAEDVIDLGWRDLLPKGEFILPPEIQGLIDHDAGTLRGAQPASSGIRGEWNGQIVRLPGFIVPLDYSGTGVTAFILVPYVGACVHVPPPPANQLVLVTTERPYESSGLFEAVHVTGMFGAASTSTALADIGYALSADNIQPYRS